MKHLLILYFFDYQIHKPDSKITHLFGLRTVSKSADSKNAILITAVTQLLKWRGPQARDYTGYYLCCNSILPARVHTPFVDGFIAKNYFDQKAAVFKQFSRSQPIGRMGQPEKIAAPALYLCSDEAGFVTGCDYPIGGGGGEVLH